MLLLLLSLVAAAPIEYAFIFGNSESYGYYFVDLWVGTPPSKQTVIIDTGSRLTAFPCTGCRECGTHLDSYFDYQASSTSRVIPCSSEELCRSCENQVCTYLQSYAEGSSIAGILVEDLVMFGDSLDPDFQTRMTFGCHTRETNLFKTQEADGIMGLAQAERAGKNIVDSMYAADEITFNTFSLCLSSNGGYMVLGGYDNSTHLEPVSWVDMVTDSFYAVHMKEVYVGSTRLSLSENDFGKNYGTGTIIDSGTTFVYLSTPVYHSLWQALEEFCNAEDRCRGERRGVSYEAHQCFLNVESTEGLFDTFPVLTFDLGGERFNWQPKDYLFVWPDYPNYYCVGIYDNGHNGSVLGGLFMRGHDFVFDRDLKQVGFAPSSCNLTDHEPTTHTPGTKGDGTTTVADSLSTASKAVLISAAVLSALLCLSLIALALYYCCHNRNYAKLTPADIEITARV
jgi:hypothetical protein